MTRWEIMPYHGREHRGQDSIKIANRRLASTASMHLLVFQLAAMSVQVIRHLLDNQLNFRCSTKAQSAK